jgi:dTDP-glucose pyrophosphorylase
MAARMKVAILAGGLGSRLSEVTERLPKADGRGRRKPTALGTS